MARNNKSKDAPSSTSDILLYFLAIFLPPASVFIKRGCNTQFWLNLLLTVVLAWLPGLIHAWYIIAKYPDVDRRAVDVAGTNTNTTPYHQQNAVAAPAPAPVRAQAPGATVPAHASAPAPVHAHAHAHVDPAYAPPPVYSAPAYQPPASAKN
ncbi:unnamed protein product [Tilletia laevis]|uniref:Uncharacterized protein n=2 Tax=Tilletia TaxID=13289 RepID=A0A177V5P3_9BASI|nr:hypothetical protein CF336_g3967 [Tilletia laevis]KAE8257613.1 hypothetical protein A4X03_0g4613 [Tilletia caries]KAE8197507.1 hypothetical protein CF335_g4599 [Tilletia laevis]CAD6889145.1 unnamed protein product [Tilletia caries]CAD6919018.1 unnamed protein product [Tilletia caries]